MSVCQVFDELQEDHEVTRVQAKARLGSGACPGRDLVYCSTKGHNFLAQGAGVR
jgi:hypothetical protein